MPKYEKILILSHSFFPKIGGIESISEILATAFYHAGHHVHLVTWSKDDSGKSFPFDVTRTPGIVKLFQLHAWADIVFENNPCLRLSWPSIFFNKPLVIGLQTWIFSTGGKINFNDRLKRRWLKRARKVIACSEAVRKRCFSSAVVINNPYDQDVFRIIPGIETTNDFIFVGRLVSDKGADLATKAIDHFLHSENDQDPAKSKVTLTIVGGGPDQEYLETMVANLNLQKNVVFTGPLRGEELAICLNRHRFILVPSVWEEPFGIVVLEGMACGCVPIVSDGGGLPEAVGQAGLIFRRGNSDSLVDCMLKIYDNPALEKPLREAAISHLSAHTSAVISKKYLEIIENA